MKKKVVGYLALILAITAVVLLLIAPKTMWKSCSGLGIYLKRSWKKN